MINALFFRLPKLAAEDEASAKTAVSKLRAASLFLSPTPSDGGQPREGRGLGRHAVASITCT